MMMKPFGLACLLSLSGAAMASAQTAAVESAPQGGAAPAAETATPPVLLELYTSQGCVSCPAADALLAELVKDPALIPLALHVDYWDYIGWADSFASPQFTERQKAYARAAGSRMIYTPQMVVAGGARVEGNDPQAVAEAIEQAKALPQSAGLQLTREGDGLRIQGKLAQPVAPLRVQLVRYKPEETVAIAHGENAGRTVTYHNIVTDWQVLADWPGEPPLDILVPQVGEGPLVVLLQRVAEGSSGPAEIVAAARID
ncbi:DUF1223 domain-containing protein [Gemmobacter serpentinus]|uniref:DUF1223 domain-containing protein n=1 Tax=Gemmobacter serpentinus TaxID=2652247 RepID=UPI001CF631FA|nr:DUF1223 domain-containing protein [Gemmobacter serpentinus]